MDFNETQNTQVFDPKVLGEQFNAIASVLADSYIKRKNKPSIEEMLKVMGTPYEEGKLYVGHIQALQQLLKEEFEVMGLDLINEITKSGEKFEIGKLSQYESKVLINKLQNVAFYTNQVKDIQNKHHNINA